MEEKPAATETSNVTTTEPGGQPVVETPPSPIETQSQPPPESTQKTEKLIDVESLDMEKHRESESVRRTSDATPKSVEKPKAEEGESGFFDLLKSELGDLPELEDMKLDGFYKDIKPEHVKELPQVARQIIHNVRRAHALEQAKHQAAIQQKEEDYQAKVRALAQREKDMVRRQEELAAIIESPEVKKALETPEGELPDPLTEEGIEARARKYAAEGLKQIFKPMQESAESARKERAWKEFVEANPEMRDDGFRNEMRELMNRHREEGQPISTQMAHKLTKLSRLEKEQQLRAQREREARAKSAQRVSRTTSTGTPNSGEIPEYARKNAFTLYKYFEEHPEAKRRVDSTR